MAPWARTAPYSELMARTLPGDALPYLRAQADGRLLRSPFLADDHHIGESMPAPSGVPSIQLAASCADETHVVLATPSVESSAMPKLFVPPGSAPIQTASRAVRRPRGALRESPAWTSRTRLQPARRCRNQATAAARAARPCTRAGVRCATAFPWRVMAMVSPPSTNRSNSARRALAAVAETSRIVPASLSQSDQPHSIAASCRKLGRQVPLARQPHGLHRRVWPNPP